jgi:hypothetical protein
MWNLALKTKIIMVLLDGERPSERGGEDDRGVEFD